MDKMNEIEYRKGGQRLSGPVEAYYIEYENKKYNLFGDAHFSMANSCHSECKNIDPETFQVDNPDETKCWEISGLLSDMFHKAAQDKQFIDFYLETPFIARKSRIPSRKYLHRDNLKDGYLDKIEYIFYNCFYKSFQRNADDEISDSNYKSDCQYDYVRFHYVDLRSNSGAATLDKDVDNVKTFTFSDATFQGFIIEEYLPAANELLSKKIRDNNTKSSGVISFTDILITGFYFTPKETRNFRLFKLYLTSDNFIEDTIQLMFPLLKIIDYEPLEKRLTDRLFIPQMIVKRKGKTMHRIRAQLEGLESEGKTYIANKILEFAFNRFKKQNFNLELLSFWKRYIEIYEKLLNGEIENIFEKQIHIGELDRIYREFQFKTRERQLATNALFMDIYTLARMFRTFPNTSHQDGNKVVIFAGFGHIKVYIDFFLFLGAPVIGFKPNQYVNYPSNLAERCIKVDIDLFL